MGSSISVVVGNTQSLSYNSSQPSMITVDITPTSLQGTYAILQDAAARVKQLAAGLNVTLTDASTGTQTGSSSSGTTA